MLSTTIFYYYSYTSYTCNIVGKAGGAVQVGSSRIMNHLPLDLVERSRKLLVAKELVGTVGGKIGLEEGDSLKVLETFTGKDLVGIK